MRRAGRILAWAVGLALGAALVAAWPAQAGADEPIGVVDVNRAGVEELQRLPGIGESRAQAIVERRREQGPFRSVEELTEIRGIGDAMLERLRPHVSLGGPEPAAGR